MCEIAQRLLRQLPGSRGEWREYNELARQASTGNVRTLDRVVDIEHEGARHIWLAEVEADVDHDRQ
jgi:hypothetical protein